MHNYDNHISLIKQLRSLNRIGQTAGDPGDITQPAHLKEALKDLETQLYNVQAITIDVNETYKSLGTTFNKVQTGLGYVVSIQEAYNKKLIEAVKNATLFDEIESSIAHTLSISTRKSYALSSAYDLYISKLSISRNELDKYRGALDSILPMQSENLSNLQEINKIREQQAVLRSEGKEAAAQELEKDLKGNAYAEVLLQTQRQLTQFQGLTAAQANDYLLYTEGSGKNVADNLSATEQLAAQWYKTTGQVGGYKTILKGVLALSSNIRAEYSRIPGNLELAVLKSQQLGVSLETVDKAATSLLDIESSVGKEIEFQMITGQRLVDQQGNSITNQLREAKLQQDPIKLMKIMNTIAEQYGETIKNGGYYQKEALSSALELSKEDLLLATQRLELNKKVALSIGKNFKDFSELSEAEQTAAKENYKAALTKTAKGKDEFAVEAAKQLIAFKDLEEKKGTDLRAPALRTADYLQSIVDDGIRIKKGGYKYETFDAKQVADTMKETGVAKLTNGMGDSVLKVIGAHQQYLVALDATKTGITDITSLLPGLSQALTLAMDALKTIPIIGGIVTALGATVEAVTRPTPLIGKGASITKKEDAVIMNDGVVQFHPSDKFMQVNDSTMIAGTSVDGNKKLAKTLGGGGVDMNKMVAAIQTAFSGVQITVNVDPMKIDREIKFRTATINSKQGRV